MSHVPKCHQSECKREAAYLAHWPAGPSLWLCRKCGAWAITIADTLGFTLAIRPLTQPERWIGVLDQSLVRAAEQSGGPVSESAAASPTVRPGAAAVEPPEIVKSGSNPCGCDGPDMGCDVCDPLCARLDALDYTGGPRLAAARERLGMNECGRCGLRWPVHGNGLTAHVCVPRALSSAAPSTAPQKGSGCANSVPSEGRGERAAVDGPKHHWEADGDRITCMLCGVPEINQARPCVPREARGAQGCGARLKFGGYTCGAVVGSGRVILCDKCRMWGGSQPKAAS